MERRLNLVVGGGDLAEHAERTHVLFNNCYRDYAQVNAQQLAEKLRG